MVKRLFTYVITHDGVFAPNPFHRVLTLNCCKPDIRRTARVGNWVAANTAADFPAGRGLLVYAIRVTDKRTMAEYDAWYCVSEKSGASWCTGTSEKKSYAKFAPNLVTLHSPCPTSDPTEGLTHRGFIGGWL